MVRKGIYFFVVVILVLSGCANDKDRTVNQTDEKGRKHGQWIEKYPNGQIQSKVRYEHGAKAGTEKTYFESGNPNTIKVWEADTFGSVLNGPYYHYYENGNPLLRMTYHEGVPVDTITQFYRSGLVEFRGQYDTGKAVGTWKYYDKNGNLVRTIQFDNYQPDFHDELRSGTYTWFDTLGNAVYRGTWYKGQPISDTILNPSLYKEWKSKEKIDLSSKAL